MKNARNSLLDLLGLLSVLLLVYTGCQPPAIPVPYIAGIEPDEAGPGEFVVLTGNNLNFANYIHFGTEKIWVNTDDADTMVVEIPDLAPGQVKVFLEYAEGISDVYEFTVLPPRPVITALIPETIEVLDTLSIRGRNFSDDAEVFLDTLSLDNLTKHTDSLISLIIPAKARSGNITVKSGDQVSFSKFLTVINSRAPSITSLDPGTFYIGDTVIIEGMNFFSESLEIKFNDLAAEDFELESEERISARVPEVSSSGFVTVSTLFGEDKIAFELLDPVSLIPVTEQTSITAFKGDTVTISGLNFKKGSLSLKYSQQDLSGDEYKILSDKEIELYTGLLNGSGTLTIENEFGDADVSITLKNLPVIASWLPEQNPVDWPMIIKGDFFEGIQQILFRKGGEEFRISINDPDVQYQPQKKTIGLKIPSLSSGNYKVSLLAAGDKSSNEIDYAILDTSPAGLPGTGSTNIIIPNNPPAAFLSSFENTWSMINTEETVSFLDESTDPNSEFGEFTGSYEGNLDLSNISGTYKRDGTEVFLQITEDGETYDYVGSLDDMYWDDLSNSSGVYRLILTPVLEGKQLELIFPVGLESLEPAVAGPEDSISVKGRIFHKSQFYEIQLTNEAENTFLFDIDVESTTEIRFLAGDLNLEPGKYKIQVLFNGTLSNALDLELE